MTFFPDGETNIPNQTPVPGIRDGQIPPGRPGEPGEQGGPSAPAPTRSDPQLTKAIIRAAMINGVVLVAAVLLAYIFPITEDETTATFIVLGAAIFSGVHLMIVSQGHQRRQREQRLATGGQPMTSTYGRVQPVAAQPYGAVRPAAPTGSFVMTVEDVFTITGRGTVVTGRIDAGEVRQGQVVTIVRGSEALTEAEVAGIEMVRKKTGVAAAGDHVGVLLRGVSRDDVKRGDVLNA